MKLGHIIKYYRKLHNLTQSEVAELSGINEKYLGRLERNESVPTIDKIEQLCLAFDIRISDFLMITPQQAETYIPKTNSDYSYKKNKIVYYCNCCGCTFEMGPGQNDIICPECGCYYDENNGYIEKSITYQ